MRTTAGRVPAALFSMLCAAALFLKFDQVQSSPASIRYISPIVFDFTAAQKLRLIHPVDAKVQFDLDGDGVLEKTGWVPSTGGFLFMDRNFNGICDNGAELFGEYTGGKRYSNGYRALASLHTQESRKLGYLDASNDNFSKLRLWFDKNRDGVSQFTEIASMKDLGITKIETTFRPAVGFANQLYDNQVPIESRYYGPKHCGKGGCRTYDVYFATLSSELSLLE